jgi:hypothetical protein
MLRLDQNFKNIEVSIPFVKIFVNWHMQDVKITDGNAFPDEVEVDLGKFCTLILNGVGGEVDDADVITVDESDL